LAKLLENECDISIITSNTDLEPSDVLEVQSGKWIKKDNQQLYYQEANKRSISFIKTQLKIIQPDVIYFNSFFSLWYFIIPLIVCKFISKAKVVLAPRGMLGTGALEQKAVKKKLYIFIFRLLRLHKKLHWHATSTQEEQDILKFFTGAVINVIPNLVQENTVHFTADKKEKNKLQLFFFSRISPKKNLLYCADILQQLPSEMLNNIQFSIYGVEEDKAYFKKCTEKLNQISELQYSFKGEILPHEITKVLAQEDILFLPTLNENFGHVIIESLAAACPVIISDQTPWNNVESNKAGFALKLEDEKAFVKAIEFFYKMDAIAFGQWQKGAIEYANKVIDLPKAKLAYKKMFDLQPQ